MQLYRLGLAMYNALMDNFFARINFREELIAAN